MTRKEQYQDQLSKIEKKIQNLEELKFTLQQKIAFYEKFPEKDKELILSNRNEKKEKV
jgi:uncharacterized protein (DUF342 family)